MTHTRWQLAQEPAEALLELTVVTDNSRGGMLSACDAQIEIFADSGPVLGFPGAPSEECQHAGPPFWTQLIGLRPEDESPGPDQEIFEVRQTQIDDYVATYAGDCDGQGRLLLSDGQAAVCTITNTFVVEACMPEVEICDGLDNDCDGDIDDGYNIGASCSPGIGECQRFGSITCNGCSASPAPPSPEICDGLDNDCDGTADDGDVCASPVPIASPIAIGVLIGVMSASGLWATRRR